MKTSIQVASTVNAESTGPCLVLQTSQGKKYVIGRCSEGLQRSMMESRIRWSKVKNVLMTGPLDWSSFGGLPGFLLTACSTNHPSSKVASSLASEELIRLHSSPGIKARFEEAVDSWNYFIFHQAIQLHGSQKNFITSEFQDGLISLKGIDLLSSDPTDKPSSSFIIQLLPIRGKFLPRKAQELGVPRGYRYAQLARGETITTPDGQVVRPEQVMEPPGEVPRVVVVDVPSEKYIDSVIQRNWTQSLSDSTPLSNEQHQKPMRLPPSANGRVRSEVSVIYHFLGENLDPFENEKYFNWIQSFGPDVVHFISHSSYASNDITLKSSYELTKDLRQVLPENFVEPFTRGPIKPFPTKWPNIRNLHHLDAIALEPKIQQYSEAVRKSEVPEKSEYSPAILDDENGLVITLGTGSSQPGKYRNVIGTIFSWKGRSIMLDCGEGTLGTINRLYEPEIRDKIVADLGLIYISHLHADHHIGSTSLILKWLQLHKNDNETLFIAGPKDYYNFLVQWNQVESDLDLKRIHFTDLEHHLEGGSSNSHKDLFAEKVKAKLGLTRMISRRAIHCESSYSSGMLFEDEQTGKEIVIAYSGDTRPNKRFAEMIKNRFGHCQLLIHEATHEDDLLEDAIAKKHSTISEAIDTGAEMGCEMLVLTHFSQRYPRWPVIDPQKLKDHNVTIAFDGMHVKLNEQGSQGEKLEELENVFHRHEELEEEGET